jgi:formiminotetrahydrofolate cyclodeaminase
MRTAEESCSITRKPRTSALAVDQWQLLQVLLGAAMILKAIQISSRNVPAADGLVRSLEEQSWTVAVAIDEDAVAFTKYLRAIRLPTGTQEQRGRGAPIVEAARQHSLAVPLKTGHALQAIAQLSINAEPLCKGVVLSDLAGGAAAAHAALLNVLRNLSGVVDHAERRSLPGETRSTPASRVRPSESWTLLRRGKY